MDEEKQIVLDIVNSPTKLLFFTKKAKAYSNVSVSDLIKMYLKQGKRCALCGDDIVLETQKTHIDHIVPRSKGGEDELSNFELVCGTCNYAKRDMSLKEFVLMCLKVQNEYYKTDILTQEETSVIVSRRWKREQKSLKKAL